MSWTRPSTVWMRSTRGLSSSSSSPSWWSCNGIVAEGVNELFSMKWLSSIPLRFGPEEFVNELQLLRASLLAREEWLTSCSCEGVRSVFVRLAFARTELRRLIEPLRLNERLNESLKKREPEVNGRESKRPTYPRLTNPFDVVWNCRTR